MQPPLISANHGSSDRNSFSIASFVVTGSEIRRIFWTTTLWFFASGQRHCSSLSIISTDKTISIKFLAVSTCWYLILKQQRNWLMINVYRPVRFTSLTSTFTTFCLFAVNCDFTIISQVCICSIRSNVSLSVLIGGCFQFG